MFLLLLKFTKVEKVAEEEEEEEKHPPSQTANSLIPGNGHAHSSTHGVIHIDRWHPLIHVIKASAQSLIPPWSHVLRAQHGESETPWSQHTHPRGSTLFMALPFTIRGSLIGALSLHTPCHNKEGEKKSKKQKQAFLCMWHKAATGVGGAEFRSMEEDVRVWGRFSLLVFLSLGTSSL